MKFPIGGKVREHVNADPGAIPGPTVTVWMKEDRKDRKTATASGLVQNVIRLFRSLIKGSEKDFFSEFFSKDESFCNADALIPMDSGLFTFRKEGGTET